MIYLDNAATTIQKPQCVIDAAVQAMTSMGNPGRGAHRDSLRAARTVFAARQKVARFFGCGSAERVAFTANATEALNIAIFGLFSRGDHVITSDLEHNSVLRPLYRLEAAGIIELSFVPATPSGTVDHEDFRRLMRPNTKAIVCTHASNLTGNLLDIETIGRIAHENGALLVIDASQTAGVFPIDMAAMGIDILCFTGHKALLAPQGTGGLCLGDGVELRPFKVGGSGVHSYDKSQPMDYPARLEAGTLNTHGIAGLSAALDYLNAEGLDRIHAREAMLTERFYRQVREIPGVTVYGDFFGPRAAIVALNIGDLDSAAVADELAEYYEIAVRPGAHCAPRMHQALGTTEQGAVRFSFSFCNTEAEIDAAASAVREIAAHSGP